MVNETEIAEQTKNIGHRKPTAPKFYQELRNIVSCYTPAKQTPEGVKHLGVMKNAIQCSKQ